MTKREKIRDQYKNRSLAMLQAIEMERKRKGIRQAEVACPRCDCNAATYCLAIHRGSVYLSTFLAFCEGLGVRVVLYNEDGRELPVEYFMKELEAQTGVDQNE